MHHPPTLKQLRYLTALHDSLHFGRAAKACHVTQSTLSAGLRELESLLDAELVERTRRTVMFTPLGEEVAGRARAILNDVDDLTAMAAAARDPLSGVVRLGVIPTIAPFLLPRIMPALADALPDLELHLIEEKSADLCRKLKDGRLDAVLFALPYACGDVTEMPLFEDPFYAAYPRGGAPGDSVTTDQLRDVRLLLLEEGHCLRDHALSACRLLDNGARETLSGTSLHTLIHMVGAGAGVTLLPGMAVDAGVADTAGVDAIPFSDLSPSRTIGLIWRPTNPRQPTFEALGKVIVDVMTATGQSGETRTPGTQDGASGPATRKRLSA
ncbi:hydrogen peroxide-inducible genes activator [Yunchengibacter salinarum]|uniref:hydrogen peroxide-inducible genes activator n=1 Tax=Yunchengibacter salinarum TaxID=3133399 RepID=UPI0035B6493E